MVREHLEASRGGALLRETVEAPHTHGSWGRARRGTGRAEGGAGCEAESQGAGAGGTPWLLFLGYGGLGMTTAGLLPLSGKRGAEDFHALPVCRRGAPG